MHKNRTVGNRETARRWIGAFYLTCLAGVLGILIYALSQRPDVEALDRNVPGATTGQGKNSVIE
jgi:hypothetical protein